MSPDGPGPSHWDPIGQAATLEHSEAVALGTLATGPVLFLAHASGQTGPTILLPGMPCPTSNPLIVLFVALHSVCSLSAPLEPQLQVFFLQDMLKTRH